MNEYSGLTHDRIKNIVKKFMQHSDPIDEHRLIGLLAFNIRVHTKELCRLSENDKLNQEQLLKRIEWYPRLKK